MDHQYAYQIEQKTDTTHDENVAWLVNDWSISAFDKMEQTKSLNLRRL